MRRLRGGRPYAGPGRDLPVAGDPASGGGSAPSRRASHGIRRTDTSATIPRARLIATAAQVSPDGSVAFSINQAPPLIRDPGLGDRLVPGVETSTRIRLSVAADGTPAVALADKAERTRVRMTVTAEGYGAIEFLNGAGEVIHVIAPEADGAP